MKESVKSVLKKIVAGGLTAAAMVSTIAAAIPMAFSKASYDTLNTNRALGSPIINLSNFETENWNKWETICWGVFLSNFCVPLIDTYESAFTENHPDGSHGEGFTALWGGSGSDVQNKEIIRALTEYAIDVQGTVTDDVIMVYYPYNGDYTGRPARFQDLFFYPEADTCPSGEACAAKWIDPNDGDEADLMSATGDTNGSSDEKYEIKHTHTYFKVYGKQQFLWAKRDTVTLVDTTLPEDGEQYDEILYPEAASYPVFYLQRGDDMEIILDYSHWWDVQVVAAMINNIRESGSKTYVDEFNTAFADMWGSNSILKLDYFGNIVTNGGGKNNQNTVCPIIVPAAVNPNITNQKSINVLNSWFTNSFVSTASESQVVTGLKQSLTMEGWLKKQVNAWFTDGEPNGLPAFGDTNLTDRIGLFYYDLDTIMMTGWKESANLKYGEALNKLFSLDINNEQQNTVYPFKFEISSSQQKKLSAWDNITGAELDTQPSAVLTNNILAAAILPNMLGSTTESTFIVAKPTDGTTSTDTSNTSLNDKVNAVVQDYHDNPDKYFTMNTSTKPTMLTKIIRPDGTELPLFNETGLVIPVRADMVKVGDEAKKPTDEGAFRLFFNYLYKVAQSSDGRYGMSNSTLESTLNGFSNLSAFNEWAKDGGFARFITQYPKYSSTKLPNVDDENSRLVLAYPCSEVMKQASQVLGIKDGAEFTTYCTYIYMTYLDFYGVAYNREVDQNANNTSNFNEKIFNDSRQDLITDIGYTLNQYNANFGDQISVKDEVANLSYLMLSPENGREYRKQLTESAMADWMYEQYNKTVYGGSDKFSGTASKAKSGFLAIETMTDNWLTGFFLENYANIAVWLIMGSIIVIIIIGLFKSKKLSWFIISIIVMINSILLVPASGDIVPYVTSSMTQKMFSNKMTYWSISQGITNSSIQQDALKKEGEMSKLTDADATQLIKLVNELGALQTDTSLSVKQDISQKITQKLGTGVYQDIVSYQSARWILPMVMQQFSSESTQESYIYKPIANIWDDMSNMYWFFDPTNANFVNAVSPTSTSGQNDVIVSSFSSASGVNGADSKARMYFSDHIGQDSKSYNTLASNIDYKNASYVASYTKNTSSTDSETAGASRGTDTLTHLVCYYLTPQSGTITPNSRVTALGVNGEEYVDADSWLKYIEGNASMATGAWESVEQYMEETANEYDRTDRNTISEIMPYLWSTESPTYYFYSVVKDSFPNNCTMANIVYALQGEVTEKVSDTEKKLVRSNFMYSTSTEGMTDFGADYRGAGGSGYLRDILDLEEMFSNMIPYMYQVNLTANGFDGVSGIFGDKVISDKLPYYEGELQSWLFRCNWAIKLMENPTFSEPMTVKDADGNQYTVNNPMLVECYPDNRPMVFSEGQMYAMGLKETDLNLVELKCIEVARRVARQWTLLINYVSTPGITPEILMRQMATDATMIFCDEFSSSGILDTTYEIYPQSLDLRYISFDSIMKMLMMNISRNTSYIYGDTMLTVIQSSDIFTAVLLLIAAWLCAFLVPLFRTTVMAVIFYLGLWALIRGLFYTNKVKTNMACGQLISNLLFMAYTLVYYAVFAIMTAMVSSDELLSVGTVSANAGSPAWVLIFIILVSIGYMVLMGMHIKFCFSNRSDMGFEKFSVLASGIAGTIKDGAGRFKDHVQNFFDRSDSEVNGKSSGTSNTQSLKGTGIRDDSTVLRAHGSGIGSGADTDIEISTDTGEQLGNDSNDYSMNFNFAADDVDVGGVDSSEIDAEIDTGSTMDDES